MSYDMDTTLKTLAEWENELDRRKTLFGISGYKLAAY